MGLRVLVGRKQAVVSTNDMSGDGVDALAERAVAMARVAPEDQVCRAWPIRRCSRRTFPISTWSIRDLPDVAALEAMARRAEDAGRAVKGVSKSGGASASAGIGGMVLVTSHGFSRRLSRLAPLRSRCRRSPAKAPAWRPTTTSPRRCTPPISTRRRRSAGAPASARSRGSIRARSRPGRCRWCSIPASPARSSGIWSAPSTARRSRARRASSRTSWASRFSRRGISIIDDPLRRRGLRSRPFDAEGVAGTPLALVEDGVLKTWLLDSATARELGLEPPATPARGASSTPSPGADQPASRAGHARRPTS